MGGQGEMALDVGNAYTTGKVIVSFDKAGTIASIAARTMSQVVKQSFSDGDILTIKEANPRAIIVINSITFKCPVKSATKPNEAKPPGALRARKGLTQYVSGASWEIKDIQCADYTLIGSETVAPWGGDTSEIDRTWCGDSCLGVRKNCDGFMYPDPGQGKVSVCKQIRKISAEGG